MRNGPIPHEVRRRVVRWASLIAGLLVGAGVLAAIAGHDGFFEYVAIAMAGSAPVIGVCALFYEVGASEDREREREADPRGPRD